MSHLTIVQTVPSIRQKLNFTFISKKYQKYVFVNVFFFDPAHITSSSLFDSRIEFRRISFQNEAKAPSRRSRRFTGESKRFSNELLILP